ncbi:hypothetical protein H6P81_010331 [Aristolochia fimbriata]|uniref:Uncharacterized protein n=1 Tax=Aristolochia fimbriata TaxID=158543 RepID=A0AAV7EPL4_ARIFI|nr:hypothetical protein H6P81_010331 [Aristolochia fimbriata]
MRVQSPMLPLIRSPYVVDEVEASANERTSNSSRESECARSVMAFVGRTEVRCVTALHMNCTQDSSITRLLDDGSVDLNLRFRSTQVASSDLRSGFHGLFSSSRHGVIASSLQIFKRFQASIQVI